MRDLQKETSGGAYSAGEKRIQGPDGKIEGESQLVIIETKNWNTKFWGEKEI